MAGRRCGEHVYVIKDRSKGAFCPWPICLFGLQCQYSRLLSRVYLFTFHLVRVDPVAQRFVLRRRASPEKYLACSTHQQQVLHQHRLPPPPRLKGQGLGRRPSTNGQGAVEHRLARHLHRGQALCGGGSAHPRAVTIRAIARNPTAHGCWSVHRPGPGGAAVVPLGRSPGTRLPRRSCSAEPKSTVCRRAGRPVRWCRPQPANLGLRGQWHWGHATVPAASPNHLLSCVEGQ